MQFGPEVSAEQRRLGAGRKNAKSCSREQNWGNLLILVFSRFQRLIPVKWPAKAQETELGAIWAKGKRRTASSLSQPKKTPKPCQSANNGVFPFPTLDSGGMACKSPKKPSWVQFGPRVSAGQRCLGASRKTAKKPPKPCQTANNGVFPFPKLDSGGMACKSLGNRVWSNSVQR